MDAEGHHPENDMALTYAERKAAETKVTSDPRYVAAVATVASAARHASAVRNAGADETVMRAAAAAVARAEDARNLVRARVTIDLGLDHDGKAAGMLPHFEKTMARHEANA